MTSSVTRLFLSTLLFLLISASPESASLYHDSSLQLANGGLNVDVTVDQRMLSRKGWRNIGQDFLDTYQHGKDIGADIETVATDENIGLAQLGQQIRDNAIISQTMNWLTRSEEGRAVQAELKSGDAARSLAAKRRVGQYMQERFGLDASEIVFYDAARTSSASLGDSAVRDIWGATIAEPGTASYGDIYLDVNGDLSKERLVATLGHELVESDYLRGKRNLLFDDTPATREAMADRFGIRFTERLQAAVGGDLGTSAAWREGVWTSSEVAWGTRQADRLGVVETRKLEWLAAGRDQFRDWSEQTIENIAKLDNRSAAERLLAAAGGVGAGVAKVGEGVLASANYLGNWLAIATVDQFNEEWGMAHAREIQQSHEALGTFFREIRKEEVRAGIGMNAWDTTVLMASGDTRAIGEFSSFFGALGSVLPVTSVSRPVRALAEIREAVPSGKMAGELDLAGSVGAARVAGIDIPLKRNSWNEFQKGTRGLYGSRKEAAYAYKYLRDHQPPYPVGVEPSTRVMLPGERFRMVLSSGQSPHKPGGFGTVDEITDTNYARDNLAITHEFKSDVSLVQEYKVVKPLTVNEGLVGPQIDKVTGEYRPGGGTQLELLVPRRERINYIKPIGKPKKLK